MTLVEQIKRTVNQLPAEKQQEVLDFITFLQSRIEPLARVQPSRQVLKKHSAFGLWKGRAVDGVEYQQRLRSDWDELG